MCGRKGTKEMTERHIRFEAESSWEDLATFTLQDKILCVAVSEEKAIDSYNETFECSIHLSTVQATELFLWLGANLPKIKK